MVARKFVVEHCGSSFDVDYDTDDGFEVLIDFFSPFFSLFSDFAFFSNDCALLLLLRFRCSSSSFSLSPPSPPISKRSFFLIFFFQIRFRHLFFLCNKKWILYRFMSLSILIPALMILNSLYHIYLLILFDN